MFESVLFFIQFSIASDILETIAAPEVEESVRLDCMRQFPLDVEDSLCDEYFKTDRYSGFRLVWASNYELAQSEPDYYSKLDAFQNTGDCCGFGPPLGCSEDARRYPSDRPLTFVPSEFTAQRQLCGNEDQWFPSSGAAGSACSQIVNPAAAVQITGGCRYEMPLGSCKDSEPEDGSLGCASILESTMNQDLRVKAAVLLAFTGFQVVSILAGCCLCWKRKATDVIPEYMERPPVDPYSITKKQKVDKAIALKMPPLPKMMIGSEVAKMSFTATLPVEEKEGSDVAAAHHT